MSAPRSASNARAHLSGTMSTLSASTALRDQPGMPTQIPAPAPDSPPTLTPDQESAPNAPTKNPSGTERPASPAPQQPITTSNREPAPSAQKASATTQPKEPAPSPIDQNPKNIGFIPSHKKMQIYFFTSVINNQNFKYVATKNISCHPQTTTLQKRNH